MFFPKLNPGEISSLPHQARDVRNIGHLGTGDLEKSIKKNDDFNETNTRSAKL